VNSGQPFGWQFLLQLLPDSFELSKVETQLFHNVRICLSCNQKRDQPNCCWFVIERSSYPIRSFNTAARPSPLPLNVTPVFFISFGKVYIQKHCENLSCQILTWMGTYNMPSGCLNVWYECPSKTHRAILKKQITPQKAFCT